MSDKHFPIQTTPDNLAATVQRGSGLAVRGKTDLQSTEPTAEQKKAEAFFRRYPRWFFSMAARSYQLSELQISKFEDKWDWPLLSQNTKLPWSVAFIDRFFSKWEIESGRDSLWLNTALPFSEAFIDHFQRDFDFGVGSKNTALPWSDALIEKYKDRSKWQWSALSSSVHIPWSQELIGRYQDQWDWKALSANEALPWSEALIDQYQDRWDWKVLSENEASPSSVKWTDRYEPPWGYLASAGLSENTALPWSEVLIDRYQDRWGWHRLSANTALPWSEALIDKYQGRWHWDVLGRNEALPWSEGFLARFEKRWYWASLSANTAVPWSVQLIARHDAKWDWRALCANPALPWSEEFLYRFEGRLNWADLSSNPVLPWSAEFYTRFAGRWAYRRLYKNEAAYSAIGEPFLMDLSSALTASIAAERELSESNTLVSYDPEYSYNHLVDVDETTHLPWTEAALALLGEESAPRFVPEKVIGIFNKFPSFQCAGETGLSCFNLTRAQVDSLISDIAPRRPSKSSPRERTEAFFRRHPDAFIVHVEKYYGLQVEQIAQYQHKWNWRNLSANENITWSKTLLDRYADLLDWTTLSANIALPWSETLVLNFEDKWDWENLNGDPTLPWRALEKTLVKQHRGKVRNEIATPSRLTVAGYLDEAKESGEIDNLDWVELCRHPGGMPEDDADIYIDRIIAAGGHLKEITFTDGEMGFYYEKLISYNYFCLTHRQIELLIDDCFAARDAKTAGT